MTVTVPASGSVIVIVSAALSNTVANSSTYISFSTTGACPGDATDATAASANLPWVAGNFVRMSAANLVTGLSAGSHTFIACYRAGSNGAEFATPGIIVIPVP